ncbi:hypothetical protein G3572_04380 [Rhodobacter sp. ETT8]|uniref:Uncharacterized protein n=1 Tax=Pseudotabrizicola algicola TaxID=2709381 RepID=A0A6B3RQN8_9RHOB|nr:hypothetical protein [Pseudotabrizicola algicola]
MVTLRDLIDGQEDVLWRDIGIQVVGSPDGVVGNVAHYLRLCGGHQTLSLGIFRKIRFAEDSPYIEKSYRQQDVGLCDDLTWMPAEISK